MRSGFLSLLLLALVSACGGGGGSSTTSAPPVAGGNNSDDQGGDNFSSGVARFQDKTSALGLAYHIVQIDQGELGEFSGGVALDDIDNDGRFELYVTHGRNEIGKLFTYDGTGFVQLEDNNGIDPFTMDRAGYFIDIDADGYKDFVSVQYESAQVFMNDQTGQFSESLYPGIYHERATFSLAAADYDIDGDIDLFFTRWGSFYDPAQPLTEYLWQNQGGGVFVDLSDTVAVDSEPSENLDNVIPEFSFTANFADIDNDGYPDMLLASDFERSQVLRNEAGIRFTDATVQNVITDKNGMGGAIGDYDRDGDLDWFVSSIHDPENISGDGIRDGNRLYRNADGLGNFEDVTDEAGVRNGYWGWGSCFADFDNDGHLDLFHTNGAQDFDDPFENDPSRLFMSNGDGTFTEKSGESGIDHTGQGRGIICADYNNDGRLDIFIANNGNAPTVFENTTDNDNHFIAIQLVGTGENPDAIGARVTIEATSGSQLREVQLGTWYLSQGPQTLHFGLGEDDEVSRIHIRWPGPGNPTSEADNIAADQRITIKHP